MVLQFANGRPFATGACFYRDRLALGQAETSRVVVRVLIGDFQTQAVVDTGGVYLVCDPEISDLLDLTPGASLGIDTLVIRGCRYEGYLQRLTITMFGARRRWRIWRCGGGGHRS